MGRLRLQINQAFPLVANKMKEKVFTGQATSHEARVLASKGGVFGQRSPKRPFLVFFLHFFVLNTDLLVFNVDFFNDLPFLSL